MRCLRTPIDKTQPNGLPEKRPSCRFGPQARMVTVCAITLLLFGFSSLKSQQLRLNLYRALVNDVALTSNFLTSQVHPNVISDGTQNGAGLELIFGKNGSFELMYLRQGKFQLKDDERREPNVPQFPSALNYFLISAGGHLANELGEIQGFGALVSGLSATDFNGSHGISKRFAFGGRLGCSWWASKVVGLKLESLFLLSPSPAYELSPPARPNFFSQTTVHQVTLTGGIMFRLCGK